MVNSLRDGKSSVQSARLRNKKLPKNRDRLARLWNLLKKQERKPLEIRLKFCETQSFWKTICHPEWKKPIRFMNIWIFNSIWLQLIPKVPLRIQSRQCGKIALSFLNCNNENVNYRQQKTDFEAWNSLYCLKLRRYLIPPCDLLVYSFQRI